MNLKQIIEKIDKSRKNEDCVDLCDIAYSEFGLDIDYVEQERLKAYWVQRWYCTDSYVGLRLYFLDDKPVAFSMQGGRKCDEYFYWIDEECAIEVKKYCMEFLIKKQDNNYYSICNLEEDIGDFYKLDYACSILDTDKIYYNGKHVEFIRTVRIPSKLYIYDEVEIKLPNGEIKQVEIKELRFKYNLKEND